MKKLFQKLTKKIKHPSKIIQGRRDVVDQIYNADGTSPRRSIK